MSEQTVSKNRPLWAFWKRAQVLDLDAAAFYDRRMISECSSGLREAITQHTGVGHKGIALAARWQGAFVGAALLETEKRTAAIRLLHVDIAHRRRGIGRRLLQGLLRRSRLQLITDIYVLATASDAGFYALHGFRPADGKEYTSERSNSSLSVSLFDSVEESAGHILMRRPLSIGFVSVPYDGVTVHM